MKEKELKKMTLEEVAKYCGKHNCQRCKFSCYGNCLLNEDPCNWKEYFGVI